MILVAAAELLTVVAAQLVVVISVVVVLPVAVSVELSVVDQLSVVEVLVADLLSVAVLSAAVQQFAEFVSVALMEFPVKCDEQYPNLSLFDAVEPGHFLAHR